MQNIGEECRRRNRNKIYDIVPKRCNPTSRYIRWSQVQNIAYAQFLQKNLQQDGSEKLNNVNQLFVKMSKQLQNGRNNHQCRSHHMKMLKKYKNVQNIIERILFSTEKELDQEISQLKQNVQQSNKKQHISSEYVLIIEEILEPKPLQLFQQLAGPSFNFHV